MRGLQSEGVVATPKHFAANFVGDGGRDSYAIHISERLLREVYLPAFEAAVREGGALSIMAAYNSLDGLPCSCNPWLLTDLLRGEWGFEGFVVSDYDSVIHILEKHAVAADKTYDGSAAAIDVLGGRRGLPHAIGVFHAGDVDALHHRPDLIAKVGEKPQRIG